MWVQRATDYPIEIDEYLVKEVKLGAMLGPFDENFMCSIICLSSSYGSQR